MNVLTGRITKRAALARMASLTCVGLSAKEATAAAIPFLGLSKADCGVGIAPSATKGMRALASELARVLGQMNDRPVVVVGGVPPSGILLGTSSEFPLVEVPWSPLASVPEQYIIRSHARGVYLVGATELATQHAGWDFLHRLGYRQFFPGQTWEVIPRGISSDIAIDAHERPSYDARRIWYGFGPWDYAEAPYAEWCARNRALSGIELNIAHAYDAILQRNRSAFEQHPEYLGLVDGKRKSSKFCISNPGLRKLVADDALQQLRTRASASVSVDPSDGGNWCECDACAQLGSISDRVVLLANEVATATNATFPGTRVGIYAYNYHSPPPNRRVHPNVVVSIATAFIKGSLKVDDLMKGWAEKGAVLGVREYYSVNTWDRDMPGQSRASNLDYLKRTIPAFHARGARYLSAESGDNWGPCGLGYYMVARMLWDVGNAEKAEELTEDFLQRAFADAKKPMRAFYQQLDADAPNTMFAGKLNRLFRALDEARSTTRSPEVQSRLFDLALYLRYVDLYQRYAQSGGAARQSNFEAVIQHAYRMRKTMLVHTKAIYRDLPTRDKSITVPPDCAWNIPEGRNPWKSSRPFSAREVDLFMAEGLRRYSGVISSLVRTDFSDELVSAAALLLPEMPAADDGLFFYVPKRTSAVWIFAGEQGEIQDSKGRTVFWLNGRKRDYYVIQVPDGEDGTLWRVRYGDGTVRLLNVPQHFARSSSDLMLPVEVVARDAIAR